MFHRVDMLCDSQNHSSGKCARATGKFALMLWAVVLTLGVGTQAPRAEDGGKAASYSKASIFFELNHTDGDLGIHVLIDGDGWHRLEVEDPGKGKMLDIELKGRLRQQGLTELFSESAEPTFDDLPPKDFFARFPEGAYKIAGTTIEGKRLKHTARVTHVFPAPPDDIKVSGVAAPKDCDAKSLPPVSKPVVISWKLVPKSHPVIGRSAPVRIVNFQVVVEREEPTQFKLSVDLPPSTRTFEVPKSFLDLDSGDGFKFEIAVREASGNQTVFESCFKF